MKKVLLCFVSDDTTFLETALETLDRQQNGIELVDSVASSEIAQVDVEECDIILVVGAKQIGMSEVTKVAHQLKLPEEKLLGDWIVCIPGFTLEKYRKLQRSHLSIFSKDCFGGIISSQLGLPFRSPFVNMFFLENDFIRFLCAPHVYLKEELILKGTAWQNTLKFDYPIVKLGNVDIHMNHYRDFGEAVKIWERRKARINWYNLFVILSTEREEILQEFDALPFGKKVCFVPFKSDLDSAWYINPEIKKGEFFWRTVHLFALGDPFYYDVFDMLLYGKKTPLIEM